MGKGDLAQIVDLHNLHNVPCGYATEAMRWRNYTTCTMRVPVLSLVRPTHYCAKLLEMPDASISTALSIRHRVSNPLYAEKKTTNTNGGMVVGVPLPSGFAPSKLEWGSNGRRPVPIESIR